MRSPFRLTQRQHVRVIFAANLLVAALACGDDDASDASIHDAREFDANDLDVVASPDVPEADATTSDPDSAMPDSAVAEDGGNDAVAPSPGVLYVNVSGSSRLAVVDVTAEGEMTEREEMRLELPRAPGAMTYDSAGRRIFLGGNMRVFTVALDAAGRPTLSGMTTIPAQPVYLSLVGDSLISAYFGGDDLRAHDVSGVPPYDETDSLDVPDEPHAALAIGRRVYIPHRNGERVSWVDVADDGTFGALEGIDSDAGVGPRHIAFHPSGEFAYVVNEFADTVSAYRVEDGALVPFGEAAPTLPAGVDGDMNTGADIHVHPSGDWLYTSNRGHDSIAVLDIAADGGVSYRDTVSTEARPREFELSASGHLLFAFGQDTGAVQSYSVEADGALVPRARLVLGEDLRWGIFLTE